LLAAMVKLCDAVAILEVGGMALESDAELQALAERIAGQARP